MAKRLTSLIYSDVTAVRRSGYLEVISNYYSHYTILHFNLRPQIKAVLSHAILLNDAR